jgi:outer membrane protein OmpA-like peptidoglycan-associated protein
MKKASWIVAVSLLGTAACASTQPPGQLVDARAAYQRASTTQGAPLVSTDVYDARNALNEAEKSFTDDGDSEKTKSLAYVAHRRAIAVEAKAAAAKSLDDRRVAQTQFDQFKEQNAMATRMQLDNTKGQLSIAQQEAEAQRQARTAADQKTQDLLSQIQGLKSAQTERGLVLTISGSVLFASGKSELLGAAKTRLGEVGKALKEDKHNIVVVGHTDSTGGEELNQRLSEARAKAVRTYLVSQGIEDGRIRSEGLGESQPVADNKGPEGRANNRRVEIILENGGQAGPAGPRQQQGGTNMNTVPTSR